VGRRSAGRKLDVEERRGIIELWMKKMSADGGRVWEILPPHSAIQRRLPAVSQPLALEVSLVPPAYNILQAMQKNNVSRKKLGASQHSGLSRPPKKVGASLL
jgi:hypothetical protein